MIKTPIEYCPIAEALFDSDGLCVAAEVNPDDGKEIAKAVNAHNKLLDALSRISDMCVGEIAMGMTLDANYIGELIYEATGMNTQELADECRRYTNEQQKAV